MPSIKGSREEVRFWRHSNLTVALTEPEDGIFIFQECELVHSVQKLPVQEIDSEKITYIRGSETLIFKGSIIGYVEPPEVNHILEFRNYLLLVTDVSHHLTVFGRERTLIEAMGHTDDVFTPFSDEVLYEEVDLTEEFS